MLSSVTGGQILAFSDDSDYRQHNIKVCQLTELAMTAPFLGLYFPLHALNVSRIAVIGVRSAKE